MTPFMAAGCLPLVYLPQAIDRFEREFFCPQGRLVVRARDDLKAHQYACAEHRTGTPTDWRIRNWCSDAAGLECGDPPLEIKADPGRVRMWQERRDRKFAELDDCYGRIFEIEGCGIRRFYATDGGGPMADTEPGGGP